MPDIVFSLCFYFYFAAVHLVLSAVEKVVNDDMFTKVPSQNARAVLRVAGPANNSYCKLTLEMSKSVCSHLGIKIKTEKCVGPTTHITFLGIEIDTLSQKN